MSAAAQPTFFHHAHLWHRFEGSCDIDLQRGQLPSIGNVSSPHSRRVVTPRMQLQPRHPPTVREAAVLVCERPLFVSATRLESSRPVFQLRWLLQTTAAALLQPLRVQRRARRLEQAAALVSSSCILDLVGQACVIVLMRD